MTSPSAPAPSPVEHAEDLGAFVTASPSSFHAAAEAARRLEAAGFRRLDEAEPFGAEPGGAFVVRDGALIAWHAPQDPEPGFRILGAHTDSPSFKLKPRPSTGRFGWRQAGVEVYGGALLNSWLDRELCLAGRLVVREGDAARERLVATGPVARIPQLAIHLDRSANEGLTLDRQANTQPVWSTGEDEGDVLAYLARHAEAPGRPVDPSAILGYDIVLADTQPPRRFGAEGQFLASGRLDNLSSVHAGTQALIRAAAAGGGASGQTLVLAAFDHEEIGSGTRSGAAGPFLEDVLVRLTAARGGAEEHRRALAASVCLSSDAGHLVHPNYPGHHDPVNRPVPGGGPLLKINANQRYATDAVGAAEWAMACEDAGVPYQEFVSHNNVPCGSTIGPITATRLGVRTVDVGLGLLSMHSAREMCHVDDAAALGRAIEAFYRR
ncbi:M18 family aminopeptidase [Rothia sp. AR01]|uniref:M18 family aminopeptidase n=1 Tax=Rothia santali TaxID=2949643 RepID=A0A9X2HEC8_9MICC|nr:M18 family aminopeptidase [Rothia santali]MCP3425689.1 M18 family aminopeptidase [Rothia santali]